MFKTLIQRFGIADSWYAYREDAYKDFAREWLEENRRGRPLLRELSDAGAAHPVEEVGSRVRGAIPSLRPEEE